MHSLIYLIRHGEIDRPVPRMFIGHTDLPLNDKGIRQAGMLHEQLQHIPFTHVFSSPLQRAVQTATLVSGKAADSVQLTKELQEIDLGHWEGLTVDAVRRRFPGEYEHRGRDLEFFRPQGGESFKDLSARCYPAFVSLVQQYPGPLLVVAHAGVNRVLLSCLQKKPLQQLLEIPQDYCGINILRSSSKKITVEAVNLSGLSEHPTRGYSF